MRSTILRKNYYNHVFSLKIHQVFTFKVSELTYIVYSTIKNIKNFRCVLIKHLLIPFISCHLKKYDHQIHRGDMHL